MSSSYKCSECISGFSSQADLGDHKFLQPSCQNHPWFSSQADLGDHKFNYWCPNCARLFSSQADLDDHKFAAYAIKGLGQFSSQADLDDHKFGAPDYVTKGWFSSQADLDDHKLHNRIFFSGRRHKFESQADLDERKTMMRKISDQHKTMFPFLCYDCVERFSSQADLDDHKTTAKHKTMAEHNKRKFAEYKRKISESSSPPDPIVRLKECGCERFSHCNCWYYSLPNNDPRRGAPPASYQIPPYQSPPIPRIPPFRGNPS